MSVRRHLKSHRSSPFNKAFESDFHSSPVSPITPRRPDSPFPSRFGVDSPPFQRRFAAAWNRSTARKAQTPKGPPPTIKRFRKTLEIKEFLRYANQKLIDAGQLDVPDSTSPAGAEDTSLDSTITWPSSPSGSDSDRLNGTFNDSFANETGPCSPLATPTRKALLVAKNKKMLESAGGPSSEDSPEEIRLTEVIDISSTCSTDVEFIGNETSVECFRSVVEKSSVENVPRSEDFSYGELDEDKFTCWHAIVAVLIVFFVYYLIVF